MKVFYNKYDELEMTPETLLEEKELFEFIDNNQYQPLAEVVKQKTTESKQPILELLETDNFKKELLTAINYGVDVDYGYDGEDEFKIETFNSDDALSSVLELLKKYFN